MARNAICKKTNIDGAVQFDWADGEQTTVRIDDFSDEMQHEFILHGMRQKFGDSYADADSISQARAQFTDAVQAVLGGNWNKRVIGVGITDLSNVISDLTGRSRAECLETLQAMPEDDVKALKKRKDVKAALARIRADRLSSATGEEEAIAIFD